MSETAACTRSLSGPVRAGASKTPGRLSSQASTEAAVPGLTNVRHGKTLSDLPFPSAKGRGVRSIFCLTACQCVSLAFRSGERPRQLPALSIESGRKSVAAITLRGDPGQVSSRRRFVPDITKSWEAADARKVSISRELRRTPAPTVARVLSQSRGRCRSLSWPTRRIAQRVW